MMLTTPLIRLLNHLYQNPMQEIVFREVTSNNIPHVAIVRNKDELIDQSISQFGNTAAYFGTGYLMDKGLNLLPRFLKFEAAKPWFVLGKSLSIFAMIAAVNMATPFLRNYITTYRTRTQDYAQMIGEKKREAISEQDLNKKLTTFKKRFLNRLGIGAAISVPLAILAAGMGKSSLGMPKSFQWLNRMIGLRDGKFVNLNNKAAVLFWVIPTFAGLLAGSRDKFEIKELGLRFGAFNFAFFVFPLAVEKQIDKLINFLKPGVIEVKPPTEGRLAKVAMKLKPVGSWLNTPFRALNTKLQPSTRKILTPAFETLLRYLGSAKNISYLAKLISSIIFCSAVPTVLNIYLTRQRVQREEAAKTKTIQPPASIIPPQNRVNGYPLNLPMPSSVPQALPFISPPIRANMPPRSVMQGQNNAFSRVLPVPSLSSASPLWPTNGFQTISNRGRQQVLSEYRPVPTGIT